MRTGVGSWVQDIETGRRRSRDKAKISPNLGISNSGYLVQELRHDLVGEEVERAHDLGEGEVREGPVHRDVLAP